MTKYYLAIEAARDYLEVDKNATVEFMAYGLGVAFGMDERFVAADLVA